MAMASEDSYETAKARWAAENKALIDSLRKESVCCLCKQTYTTFHNLHGHYCHFHPGDWNGSAYSCCGGTLRTAGCLRSMHISSLKTIRALLKNQALFVEVPREAVDFGFIPRSTHIAHREGNIWRFRICMK